MAIKDRRISPWGFVGVGGMVCALFPYLFGGLVMPYWAVGVLLVVWLVMFVVTCRWFVSHPRRTLVMPVLAFALWFGVLAAGGAFLDWTA